MQKVIKHATDDKRAATYYRDRVSLAAVGGRVECESDPPDNPEATPHDKYLLNEDYPFSTGTVHYDSDADKRERREQSRERWVRASSA